jgi:RPAP1-like, C-terminal
MAGNGGAAPEGEDDPVMARLMAEQDAFLAGGSQGGAARAVRVGSRGQALGDSAGGGGGRVSREFEDDDGGEGDEGEFLAAPSQRGRKREVSMGAARSSHESPEKMSRQSGANARGGSPGPAGSGTGPARGFHPGNSRQREPQQQRPKPAREAFGRDVVKLDFGGPLPGVAVASPGLSSVTPNVKTREPQSRFARSKPLSDPQPFERPVLDKTTPPVESVASSAVPASAAAGMSGAGAAEGELARATAWFEGDAPKLEEPPENPIDRWRFDFRGNALTPNEQRTLPAEDGLHHHGLQPDLAGYTLGELDMLARSSVVGQCTTALSTLTSIVTNAWEGKFAQYLPDKQGLEVIDVLLHQHGLPVLGHMALASRWGNVNVRSSAVVMLHALCVPSSRCAAQVVRLAVDAAPRIMAERETLVRLWETLVDAAIPINAPLVRPSAELLAAAAGAEESVVKVSGRATGVILAEALTHLDTTRQPRGIAQDTLLKLLEDQSGGRRDLASGFAKVCEVVRRHASRVHEPEARHAEDDGMGTT